MLLTLKDMQVKHKGRLVLYNADENRHEFILLQEKDILSTRTSIDIIYFEVEVSMVEMDAEIPARFPRKRVIICVPNWKVPSGKKQRTTIFKEGFPSKYSIKYGEYEEVTLWDDFDPEEGVSTTKCLKGDKPPS